MRSSAAAGAAAAAVLKCLACLTSRHAAPDTPVRMGHIQFARSGGRAAIAALQASAGNIPGDISNTKDCHGRMYRVQGLPVPLRGRGFSAHPVFWGVSPHGVAPPAAHGALCWWCRGPLACLHVFNKCAATSFYRSRNFHSSGSDFSSLLARPASQV